MKYGKLRTLRGQITVAGGTGRKNIIVSDGLVNHGLIVRSFKIWNDQLLSATTRNHTAILSLDTISVGTSMDAADNRQIAWNVQLINTTVGVSFQQSIIDPNHIVNRDLFLTFMQSSNVTYNYLIECQVVELSDDEAIITIIKETSQS